MQAYPIAEAKSRFSELMKQVEGGATVLITRGSKKEEVAVLMPAAEWRKGQSRQLGTLQGKMYVEFADDWSVSDESLVGL